MTAPRSTPDSRVGFLEESAGVLSSSRLFSMIALGAAVLAALLLGGYVVYVLVALQQQPNADVIRAFGTVIVTLGGAGAAAISTRNLGA